jgi:hypothetical protein
MAATAGAKNERTKEQKIRWGAHKRANRLPRKADHCSKKTTNARKAKKNSSAHYI